MTSGRLGRAARMTCCDTRAEEKRPKGRALITDILGGTKRAVFPGKKPALNRKSLANLPRECRRNGATDQDR